MWILKTNPDELSHLTIHSVSKVRFEVSEADNLTKWIWRQLQNKRKKDERNTNSTQYVGIVLKLLKDHYDDCWSDETTQVFPSPKIMRTNRRISNFTVIGHPSTVQMISISWCRELYASIALSSAHWLCIRCCMLCTTFLTEVFYSFLGTMPAIFITTSRSLVQSDLLNSCKNFSLP